MKSSPQKELDGIADYSQDFSYCFKHQKALNSYDILGNLFNGAKIKKENAELLTKKDFQNGIEAAEITNCGNTKEKIGSMVILFHLNIRF